MRHYENLVVIKATLTNEEIESQVEALKQTIVDNGGEIVAVNNMGIKKLAYEVQKQKRGYYTNIFYKIAPNAIKEIERLERLNEDVIKFITVKYDNKREVAAFDQMVNKIIKKQTAKATPAPTPTPAPASAEETPVVEDVKEEAPVEETTTTE
jgi:small subunit ribosomal protein S6